MVWWILASFLFNITMVLKIFSFQSPQTRTFTLLLTKWRPPPTFIDHRLDWLWICQTRVFTIWFGPKVTLGPITWVFSLNRAVTAPPCHPSPKFLDHHLDCLWICQTRVFAIWFGPKVTLGPISWVFSLNRAPTAPPCRPSPKFLDHHLDCLRIHQTRVFAQLFGLRVVPGPTYGAYSLKKPQKGTFE